MNNRQFFTFSQISKDDFREIYECERTDQQADAHVIAYDSLSVPEQTQLRRNMTTVGHTIALDDKKIGWIFLSPRLSDAHLGYGLFPPYRGRKLMSQIIPQYMTLRNNELLRNGVQKILASTLPENTASRRVLEKLDFQVQGTKRVEHAYIPQTIEYIVYHLKISDF